MDLSTRERASLSIASVAPRMLSPHLRRCGDARLQPAQHGDEPSGLPAVRGTAANRDADERFVQEVRLHQAADARIGGIGIQDCGLPERFILQRGDTAEEFAVDGELAAQFRHRCGTIRGNAVHDPLERRERLVDCPGLGRLVRDVEQEVLLVPAQLQRSAADGVGQLEENRLLLDLDEVQVEECRKKRDNEGAQEEAEHDLLLQRHAAIVAPGAANGSRRAAGAADREKRDAEKQGPAREGWSCLRVSRIGTPAGTTGSTGSACSPSCAGATWSPPAARAPTCWPASPARSSCCRRGWRSP